MGKGSGGRGEARVVLQNKWRQVVPGRLAEYTVDRRVERKNPVQGARRPRSGRTSCLSQRPGFRGSPPARLSKNGHLHRCSARKAGPVGGFAGRADRVRAFEGLRARETLPLTPGPSKIVPPEALGSGGAETQPPGPVRPPCRGEGHFPSRMRRIISEVDTPSRYGIESARPPACSTTSLPTIRCTGQSPPFTRMSGRMHRIRWSGVSS